MFQSEAPCKQAWKPNAAQLNVPQIQAVTAKTSHKNVAASERHASLMVNQTHKVLFSLFKELWVLEDLVLIHQLEIPRSSTFTLHLNHCHSILTKGQRQFQTPSLIKGDIEIGFIYIATKFYRKANKNLFLPYTVYSDLMWSIGHFQLKSRRVQL